MPIEFDPDDLDDIVEDFLNSLAGDVVDDNRQWWSYEQKFYEV